MGGGRTKTFFSSIFKNCLNVKTSRSHSVSASMRGKGRACCRRVPAGSGPSRPLPHCPPVSPKFPLPMSTAPKSCSSFFQDPMEKQLRSGAQKSEEASVGFQIHHLQTAVTLGRLTSLGLSSLPSCWEYFFLMRIQQTVCRAQQNAWHKQALNWWQ